MKRKNRRTAPRHIFPARPFVYSKPVPSPWPEARAGGRVEARPRSVRDKAGPDGWPDDTGRDLAGVEGSDEAVRRGWVRAEGEMTQVCPHCNATVPEDSQRCPACGQE